MTGRRFQRGESILGMLVILVLIIVGFVLYFRLKPPEPGMRRPGGPTSTYGQSLEKGKSTDCQNNLRQIRFAITMERTQGGETEAPPPTLQSLQSQNIGPQMLKCPVQNQPYQYNPQTGQVWCPTPGHERF